MTTLPELRQQISAAQAKKAKAEVIVEQAQADLEASRGRLQAEFGVSTPAEAKDMIAALTQQRDDAILAAETQLKEAH
jgi:hypothetical protein